MSGRLRHVLIGGLASIIAATALLAPAHASAQCETVWMVRPGGSWTFTAPHPEASAWLWYKGGWKVYSISGTRHPAGWVKLNIGHLPI